MNPLRLAQYAGAGVGIVGSALSIFINGAMLNKFIHEDFKNTEATDTANDNPEVVEAK